MIEFGHGTHRGLRRKVNEDTYHADSARGLFLVADGMGGHAHGMHAAALARDTVTAKVRAGEPLVAAIRAAGATVSAQPRDTAARLPMGTTLVAVHIRGRAFTAAWVGDSRIYVCQDNRLHQLSHDQSLVQELVDRGVLDAEDAPGNPRRNVLTQALGVTRPEELHIDAVNGRIAHGMRFLLCSDGLTEHVRDDALAATLVRTDIAAQEMVDLLILQALDRGGDDNVTALVVSSHAD
jgi:protein phosphatase